MILSRCGIECDTAACKTAFGVDCAGCVNIAQPFHGACPVKECCEGRGHTHCGQCVDVPCELLMQYSCDPEHGDKPMGKRIQVCLRWAREE